MEADQEDDEEEAIFQASSFGGLSLVCFAIRELRVATRDARAHPFDCATRLFELGARRCPDRRV